jgi:hypothetical protein
MNYEADRDGDKLISEDVKRELDFRVLMLLLAVKQQAPRQTDHPLADHYLELGNRVIQHFELSQHHQQHPQPPTRQLRAYDIIGGDQRLGDPARLLPAETRTFFTASGSRPSDLV